MKWRERERGGGGGGEKEPCHNFTFLFPFHVHNRQIPSYVITGALSSKCNYYKLWLDETRGWVQKFEYEKVRNQNTSKIYS